MLKKTDTVKIINPSTFTSLSNIQAVLLQMLVLIVTTGYGIYHLLYDQPIIGCVATFSAVFSFLCIRSIYKKRVSGYYFLIFFISQFLCLVFTSYFYGLRGLILIFPVSAGVFYVLYYRLAFYASSVLVLSSLFAASNVLDIVTLIRIAIALFLSISFLAAFSYVVTKQYKNLEYDANHDYLTGMLNRRGFSLWLKRALAGGRVRGSRLILLHLDLDGFKSINEHFGQNYGDELLIALPNRILSTLRSGGFENHRNDYCHLARLSGDEFALAIEGVESRETAQFVAARIIERTTEPFQILDTELCVSMSVGIASAEHADYHFSALMNHANTAMRTAKNLGKNGFCYFDEEVSRKQEEQDKVEQLIRTALKNDGFEMVFQPVYYCDSHKLKGAEALIRCPEASALGIYPDTFIPVAEKVGLIRTVDLWVIESVLKTIASIPTDHPYRDLEYSINISALELQNSLFPNKLRDLFKRYPVSVSNVQLEITETSLVSLDDCCLKVLQELSAIGVKLALDDFGTGYTAFNQLRKYPVDTLKIDRSFIVDLDGDREKASEMIELMLSLAKLYKLKVTAEGVETLEQLSFLRNTRCDYIQGYVLSRPIPWAKFMALPLVGDPVDCETLASVSPITQAKPK